MNGNELRFRQFFEHSEVKGKVGNVQSTLPFGSLAALFQLDRALRQLAALSPTYRGDDPLGDYINAFRREAT